MKKTYKSKVETIILVPLALLLLFIEILMLINRFWIGAALCLVICLFIVYLYYFTFYELADQKLMIRSGFLYKKEIYISTIKKVRSIRSHLVSPALSADRLEVSYNRYGRVLISPNETSEFISQLTKVNPKIRVS